MILYACTYKQTALHQQARLPYWYDTYAKAAVKVCRKVNAAAAAAGG